MDTSIRRQIMRQYPDLYSRDNSRYTYFQDNGEKITYIAGQDGITEEWIRKIRQLHRDECNMARQGRSKGEGANCVISLEIYRSDTDDNGRFLLDPDSDPLEGLIDAEDSEESAKLRKLAESGLNTLPELQRNRFLLYTQGVTIREIARREKTSHVAILRSIGLAKKKLQSFIVKHS